MGTAASLRGFEMGASEAGFLSGAIQEPSGDAQLEKLDDTQVKQPWEREVPVESSAIAKASIALTLQCLQGAP
jgi:hypothetical protein